METAINQLFQRGITAHKAGQLPKVKCACKAVFDIKPHHPEASHKMGVIIFEAGQDEYTTFFKTALTARLKTV